MRGFHLNSLHSIFSPLSRDKRQITSGTLERGVFAIILVWNRRRLALFRWFLSSLEGPLQRCLVFYFILDEIKASLNVYNYNWGKSVISVRETFLLEDSVAFRFQSKDLRPSLNLIGVVGVAVVGVAESRQQFQMSHPGWKLHCRPSKPLKHLGVWFGQQLQER